MNVRPTGPYLPLLIVLAGGLLAAGSARAQTRDEPTLDDLLIVRSRPTAYRELLQIKAGLLGGFPTSSDDTRGLETQYSADGHIYYLSDKLAGKDTGTELYAGRDGFYAGFKKGAFNTAGAESRIELYARPWAFYREGFYRGKDFIPVGKYEGKDYGARLGFSSMLSEGFRIEVAGKYVHHQFSPNDDTDPSYQVPDDFNSYGSRITVEQNTMTLDRRIHWPVAGFIAAIFVDIDWNDLKNPFGITGRTTELPDKIFRGGLRLEYLYPASDTGTWELTVDGGMSDELDRIAIYDAQKPIGTIFVDGSIGFRLMLGEATAVTPGFKAQWVRSPDEFGQSTDENFFVGGYLRFRTDVSASVSLIADYSYLSNESREPISITKDTMGEHRFFIGGVARFGTPGR